MSYNQIQCNVIPVDTFKIKRGCPHCGTKQLFESKKRFRTNANGKKVDIWMIYGCQTCDYTYNLPVYERVSPQSISRDDYEKFLASDEELLMKYGTNKELFQRNKAEISQESTYELRVDGDVKHAICKLEQTEEAVILQIDNQTGQKLRDDKLVAAILGVSRTKAKEYIQNERILVEMI